MSKTTKPPVDWGAIEPHYCAGIRSLKSIGAEFSVSDAGIIKHAEKHGWKRAAKVSAKVRKPKSGRGSGKQTTNYATTQTNIAPGLTPKQERFCIEYLKSTDATAAYRAAYDAGDMLPATVNRKASLLLAQGKVAARIAALRNAAAEIAVISQSQVLAEAARLGLSDAGELFDEHGDLKPIKDLAPAIRACIASVEIDDRIEGHGEDARTYRVKKVKLWDKNAALEKLMKHLGMYEADNKQRAGVFDKVPLELMKTIEDRLRALQRIDRPDLAGQPAASSSSRFTH